jgi:hypothetical protein
VSKLPQGIAYAFLRANGAPLPPGCAGHVAWGFMAAQNQFSFGSTENPAGTPAILPGHDAGFWTQRGPLQAMLQAMKQRHYNAYKSLTLPDAMPDAAAAKTNQVRGSGYTAIGNNCLDHVCWILGAYNVKDLPWASTHPSPNDWFGVLPGEYHNL